MTTATTDVFRAVADPTRRKLLDLLRNGPRGFGELHEATQLSKGAVSQQLATLSEIGLVERHEAGRRSWFELTPAPLAEVADWVAGYEQMWDEALDRLGRAAAETSEVGRP